MGMFDDLRCKFPLPLPQFEEMLFQSKDTPAQFMDAYEIREDGTLWHESYDVEDQSKKAEWVAAHPGEAPPAELNTMENAFLGCMARVRKRWEQVTDFVGEIRFYNTISPSGSGWIEFSAYFVGGKLNQLYLVAHRPPET